MIEDRLFVVTMWWRVVWGLFRVVFGMALLKIVGNPLIDVVRWIMHYELTEDPHDVLYVMAENIMGHNNLYITYFLAFYFIFWGVVDVFLSYNLLKYRLWAFPTTIILMALFITYELLRYSHSHSKFLLGAVAFDLVVLWLINIEYKKKKQQHANRLAVTLGDSDLKK